MTFTRNYRDTGIFMMKSKFFTILSAVFLLLPAAGCQKRQQALDLPFVQFLPSTATSIDCMARRTAEYPVHYSGKKPTEPIEVRFSVTAGDGLREGTDYRMDTRGDRLVFLPGIYELPVRVTWLPHELDSGKDNSLTLRLEQVNREEVRLGVPGPGGKYRELKIVKF